MKHSWRYHKIVKCSKTLILYIAWKDWFGAKYIQTDMIHRKSIKDLLNLRIDRFPTKERVKRNYLCHFDPPCYMCSEVTVIIWSGCCCLSTDTTNIGFLTRVHLDKYELTLSTGNGYVKLHDTETNKSLGSR